MKTVFAVTASLLAFSVASAGEPPDPDVRELVVTPPPVAAPSDVPRLLAESRNIVVPLPAKTPFDLDRGDRHAYRKAYRAGYRFTAATRWMSTCCLFADVPHREAIIAGHSAGQLAAMRGR